MSTHLQKDIEKLKNKIITMGGEVEDRVYKATLSIINRDAELAQSVIKSDYDIDQMEVDIEDYCLKTLALYQPVAKDLRYIIAILKINNDLERVGDLAVNIAERSRYISAHPQYELFYDIETMAVKTEKMLTGSIDSLVQMNAQLAHQIRAEDDVVDEYTRQMYKKSIDIVAKDPDHIHFVLQAVTAGRHLERIADHATNIAEDVIYLVDAEIVRHTPEDYEE